MDDAGTRRCGDPTRRGGHNRQRRRVDWVSAVGVIRQHINVEGALERAMRRAIGNRRGRQYGVRCYRDRH